ncbi:hypothetical protein ACFYY8_29360 [Streptosporangium sp. NPDC001559]|uniref:hypothetical protein n=1 Tax=Streptosporangium sp. NPDC001559 TaxID=3366187 RepID=UPI0036EBDAB6
MKTRKLPVVATIAAVLTAGSLVGTAAATAVTKGKPRTEQQGPYTTSEECQRWRTYAGTHGAFTYLSPCYYHPGDFVTESGNYFILVY